MKKALIGFLAVSLAACAEGSTAPEPSDAAVGTYSLVKVAGQPLPYAGKTSTVVSGTLVIRADHTLDLKYTLTFAGGAGTPTSNSIVGSGTWLRNGSAMPIAGFTVEYVTISGVYDTSGITLRGTLVDAYGGDFFWSKTP